MIKEEKQERRGTNGKVKLVIVVERSKLSYVVHGGFDEEGEFLKVEGHG